MKCQLKLKSFYQSVISTLQAFCISIIYNWWQSIDSPGLVSTLCKSTKMFPVSQMYKFFPPCTESVLNLTILSSSYVRNTGSSVDFLCLQSPPCTPPLLLAVSPGPTIVHSIPFVSKAFPFFTWQSDKDSHLLSKAFPVISASLEASLLFIFTVSFGL